jgi:hypothetical protein
MKKTKTKSKKSVVEEVIENDGAADLATTECGPLPERIPVDSLAAARVNIERGSVLRELRHTVIRMAIYQEENYGSSTDEAVAYASDPHPGKSTEEVLKQIEKKNLESLDWWEIAILFGRDQEQAERIWKLLKQEARREFLSGHRVARVSETGDWQREPWKRARFLAIRDGFVEQWKPSGAIELAMIDTMAQAHSEYLYWSEEVHRRSTTEMKMSQEVDEDLYYKRVRGNWIPPRVGEQNAIEHSMQMMDRYNRLFLRTLRQLRDLRRYSMPITINNPQQVNIAADGGKQVNVADAERQPASRPLLSV